MVGRVGGGVLPRLELSGPAVALTPSSGSDPATVAARLRANDSPLLARITDGRVVIDPRTLRDDELDTAADAIRRARA